MAAIYSGIHLKLKSSGTSWEDKLKLARFAWISSQCLLPNKEQVLLDWSTHALTGFYSKKVEFSQTVLEGLWCYLDDLLNSRKLHSLLSQGKTITLKLNVAQVLLERLQECVCDGVGPSVSVTTLLSVFKGILSSPTLSSIFTTKYELTAELLSKFCSLACHRLQHRESFVGPPPDHALEPITESVTSEDELMDRSLQSHPTTNFNIGESRHSSVSHDQPSTKPNTCQSQPLEDPQSGHIFDVLLQVLSCYLSVQRQQANPNRVFTVVMNQLFQPTVLMRHLLTTGEQHTSMRLRQQLSRDIRIKIDSILQLALFPSELLTSYKEELFPPKADSGKRGAKGLLRPVHTLLCKLSACGFCELSVHYSVKSNALSLLFKLYLESYGRGGGGEQQEQRMACFHFLTKLVPALDLNVDSSSSSVSSSSANSSKPQSWSLALLGLEALLSQALSADIYNVAADKIKHKEVQLHFYRALVQILFNHAQPSIPAWYRCLKVLLGLNHLILEPDLDQLLSLAWVDSDCMESRVQRARQLLVCHLLETYTKLRQLPRLFSELLSIVCRPASDDLRPLLLTDELCASIKTCVLDTPPTQALEICSLVLESIRLYILPELEKESGHEKTDTSGDGEQMEIDRHYKRKNTKEKMDQDNGISAQERDRSDSSLKLVSHSQLLHTVLFSLKTIDNASPVPLVRQTSSIMEEMGHIVKALLQLVTSETMPQIVGLDGSFKTSEKKLGHAKATNPSGQNKDACAPWKEKCLEASLLLRYTCVEVDSLFFLHCGKYTSLESLQALGPRRTNDHASDNASVLAHIEALLSGEILPARFLPFLIEPSCNPKSCWLLKLLILQQLKKVLLDTHLLSDPKTAAALSRAANFIIAKDELLVSLDQEQEADGQAESASPSSYHAQHWYLVTSSLPLIAPYLTQEDVGCVAEVLVSSLLNRNTDGNTDWLPVFRQSCRSVSAISSQLLESPLFVELPSLYSTTVQSVTGRILGVLLSSGVSQVCPALRVFQDMMSKKKSTDNRWNKDANQAFADVKLKTLVEEILRSSQAVLLSDAHIRELLNLVHIAANLNPDGINPEDLSCLFLLLLFILTSSRPERAPGTPANPGDHIPFLEKLLRLMTCLVEGSNFPNVLKLIHGSSLLQAVVSSILTRSSKERFCCTDDGNWCDVVRSVQAFIKSLVQLIIIRNSSVRLNLEQFTSYLTSIKIAGRQPGAITSHNTGKISGLGTPEPLHLLLASLTSFSEAMTSHLGRGKPLDETLTQMIARTTAALGPAIETIVKPQSVNAPVDEGPGVLGQVFLVKVVTVMLQCELSTLPVEGVDTQSGSHPVLSRMTLYRTFCQKILKEISSAPRPKDFLVPAVNFMLAFYSTVKRIEGERKEGEDEKKGREVDELYTEILQKAYRLFAADWLSLSDLNELEVAVGELLRQLLERSTTGQFNLLLLLIREGLDVSKLRAGNNREVLSAVTITKLLSLCPLPEACATALWLIAPQIISAMVFIVRSSSQELALTLPLTVPTITSITSLLRQGEGLISNPHHVTLILGALQLVPLDHLTPSVYQATFLAVHEALFAIINCHLKVMLSAAPSFLNIFYRLVASVMHEGRQKGDGDAGADGDVYLQCSRLVERMYSHIAATAKSFTTLAVCMVAQYVTELQKVTLRPDIKLHLTEGIYQIMDLCIERDIKFLTAGLQMGVREVFNELYGSYVHYHKVQRQGEDKYTA